MGEPVAAMIDITNAEDLAKASYGAASGSCGRGLVPRRAR